MKKIITLATLGLLLAVFSGFTYFYHGQMNMSADEASDPSSIGYFEQTNFTGGPSANIAIIQWHYGDSKEGSWTNYQSASGVEVTGSGLNFQPSGEFISSIFQAPSTSAIWTMGVNTNKTGPRGYDTIDDDYNVFYRVGASPDTMNDWIKGISESCESYNLPRGPYQYIQIKVVNKTADLLQSIPMSFSLISATLAFSGWITDKTSNDGISQALVSASCGDVRQSAAKQNDKKYSFLKSNFKLIAAHAGGGPVSPGDFFVRCPYDTSTDTMTVTISKTGYITQTFTLPYNIFPEGGDLYWCKITLSPGSGTTATDPKSVCPEANSSQPAASSPTTNTTSPDSNSSSPAPAPAASTPKSTQSSYRSKTTNTTKPTPTPANLTNQTPPTVQAPSQINNFGIHITKFNNVRSPKPTQSIHISSGGTIHLKGTSAPNLRIKLYIYSSPITATVKADPTGHWQYTLNQKLSPGNHHIEAAQIDSVGKEGAKIQLAQFELTKESILVTYKKPFAFISGVLALTLLSIAILLIRKTVKNKLNHTLYNQNKSEDQKKTYSDQL